MIAIVSDIHGNLPALKAVLREILKMGCTRIISLGDITGYYSEPKECIDELLALKATQLLGNHDKYLVDGVSCPRSKVVSDLIVYQRKIIPMEQIKFLSTLSSRYEEADSSYVHGGWEDPNDEYMYHISYSKLIGTKRFYFSGHTHVQTLVTLKDKIYCNPGSVGQPRDGDPRAAFATMEKGVIQLHRVKYEIAETVKAMKAAGFKDKKLWENLYIGAQIGGRIDKVSVET